MTLQVFKCCVCIWIGIFSETMLAQTQKVVFSRDFSPDNWGDEGKGKITDMLAKESDIIIRFQGGSKAGHTIINDYGKFALQDVYKRQEKP